MKSRNYTHGSTEASKARPALLRRVSEARGPTSTSEAHFRSPTKGRTTIRHCASDLRTLVQVDALRAYDFDWSHGKRRPSGRGQPSEKDRNCSERPDPAAGCP